MRVAQVNAIQSAVDGERLGQFGRADAIAPLATDGNGLLTFLWLNSAQQHGGREALRLGDGIQHPMHAIGKVDVGMPGRAIHDGIAPGPAGFGVAAQVGLADVGLGLDNDAAEPLAIQIADQAHAEQCAGDGQGGAGIEFVRQANGGWHGEKRLTRSRGRALRDKFLRKCPAGLADTKAHYGPTKEKT